MPRMLLLIGVLLGGTAHGQQAIDVDEPPIRIGSKTFTESIILGEILTQLVRDAGYPAEHVRDLGGTGVLWNALRGGEIDLYVEYTGTLTQELLAGQQVQTLAEIRAAIAGDGIRISDALGFNNTYAIGTTRAIAAANGLGSLSDLRDRPQLKLGFSSEFMERGDGWPALRAHYELPQTDVNGMDQRLAYQALLSGAIQVMDFYATDAEIKKYDLVVLRDDRAFFPRYDGVVAYRDDLAERAPEVVFVIDRLAGTIDDDTMVALNARAIVDGLGEAEVAAEWVRAEYGITTTVRATTPTRRVIRTTAEHLWLVLVSLVSAVVVALPLGVWAAKDDRMAQPILGAVGILQTIPSLALLVLLMWPLSWLSSTLPWLATQFGVRGIGEAPAIVALFLYSLLPIVRNTHAGLVAIPSGMRESALALGLPAATRLWRIELPLASRTILAGIKTAAVINVGFATLGALIGAGGYGQPILTGIRRNDFGLILEGAVPAASLALLAQGLFEIAERGIVPRGLRLKRVTQ
jgi:osmoprotectant transport system permease protein